MVWQGNDSLLLVTDLIAAASLVVSRAPEIALWVRDPRRAAIRRYDAVSHPRLFTALAAASRSFMAEGCACVYGAFRADLGWVWGVLAVFLIVLSAVTWLMVRWGRDPGIDIPKRQAGPLTRDQLMNMVSTGQRRALVHFGVLLLWLYSWRTILEA